MKIKPTKVFTFNKFVHIANDIYGFFIISHATEWAEMMEKQLQDKNIKRWDKIIKYMENNADYLSFQTNQSKNGLTGYQHYLASNLLINTWAYGFELWLGHNIHFYKKGYPISDYNKKYVEMWLGKKYTMLSSYKRQCDDYYKIKDNTTYLRGDEHKELLYPNEWRV